MIKLAKKLLLTSSIILAITGCTVTKPNLTLKSNPQLPKVKKIRYLADRNSVALEWEMVNKPQIKGYYIQRIGASKKAEMVKKIESKYITHWSDINLESNKEYVYQIATYDKKGVPSPGLKIKTKTFPTISPVSFFEDSGLKVRGIVKLIFRPHQNERVEGYILQRFDDVSGKWKNLADIKPRLSAEYLDTNLQDGKVYKYRLIAYTFDGLKSLPTKSVEIQTLQRPSVVENISASTNLAKRIELKWSKVPKVVKYNIYYADSKNGDYSLLATTKENKYIDLINRNGFTKYYKITSLDKYGTESLYSQIVMGQTLNIPQAPVISLDRTPKQLKFIITSPDQRAVSYNIVKENGENIEKFTDVHSPFIDKKVKARQTYVYKIYAIDKNGLASKPAQREVHF